MAVTLPGGGFLLFWCGEAEDGGKFAVQEQIDAVLSFTRRKVDPVDQFVDQLASAFDHVGFAADQLGHVGDLLSIIVDDRRVRDRHRDFGHVGLRFQQRCSLGLQLFSARLQAIGGDTRNDRVDDPISLAVVLFQLSIDVSASGDQAPALGCPLEAEFLEICGNDIGVEHVALQRRPDALLQCVIGNGRAVAAGSALALRGAAPAVGRDDDDGTAALGTPKLAREKALACSPLWPSGSGSIEPLLGFGPECVVDDAQRGHVLADQIAIAIGARDPPPRVRVLAERLPIIDDLAHVEPVVEDAVAALPATGDGIGTPDSATRGGDTFSVQPVGDDRGAIAARIFFEDPQNDCRLVRIDLAQATLGFAILAQRHNLAVAVRQSAGDATCLHPPDVPAANLVGELLEKDRRHRAAEPDMHGPNFAFGEGDNAAFRETHPLEDTGQVLLVA